MMLPTPLTVFTRSSGRAAMDAIRPGPRDTCPLEPVIQGRRPLPDAPEGLMVLSYLEAPTPLIPEVVYSGNSVLWLTHGTCDQAIKRLLSDRMPSNWLRGNLVSMAFRTDAPQPHSAANKLGFDECGPMHWTVEVLRPQALAA